MVYFYAPQESVVGRLTTGLTISNVIFSMFTIESVPFLLANNREAKALQTLAEYRGERVASTETHHIFADLLANRKSTVTTSIHSTWAKSALHRLLALFSSGIPIIIIMHFFGSQLQQSVISKHIAFSTFLAIRLLTSTSLQLLTRCITKRHHLLYILAAVNAIALLLLLSPLRNNSIVYKELIVIYLLTNCLMAVGIDTLKNEQMLNVCGNRPWSIAFDDICEQFVQAILFVLLCGGGHNIAIAICGFGCLLIVPLLVRMANAKHHQQIGDELTIMTIRGCVRMRMDTEREREGQWQRQQQHRLHRPTNITLRDYSRTTFQTFFLYN